MSEAQAEREKILTYLRGLVTRHEQFRERQNTSRWSALALQTHYATEHTIQGVIKDIEADKHHE